MCHRPLGSILTHAGWHLPVNCHRLWKRKIHSMGYPASVAKTERRSQVMNDRLESRMELFLKQRLAARVA